MTLFPETLGDVLSESIIGRAQDRGRVRIECHQIRDYTHQKQMQVDDYPYGGGMGMVMQADPLYNCWQHICDEAGERVHTVLMSPQGKVFTQDDAKRLRDKGRFIIVCGHYEGVDERFIEQCVDEEISIGDFVLTGGEIPAMAVADSVCRLCPGVLADDTCFEDESHWSGLLEYPQYSRPEVWHEMSVPPVLLSGNHAAIASWRRKQSMLRTMQRRPDMYRKLRFETKQDKKLLDELIAERGAFDCRLAVPEDIDGIMNIIAQACDFLKRSNIDQWQDGYPQPEIFLEDIAAGECWVFTCRREIAAVVTIAQRPDPCYAVIDGQWLTQNEPYGVIHRSAIGDKYRGTVLARQLFAFSEGLCKAGGCAAMRVDTHAMNRPMHALAKRFGYKLCGTIKVNVGSGHDPLRDGFEKII